MMIFFFIEGLSEILYSKTVKKGKLINNVFMFFFCFFLPNGNLRRGRRVQVEEEGKAGLVYNKTIEFLVKLFAFIIYAFLQYPGILLTSSYHADISKDMKPLLCTKRI